MLLAIGAYLFIEALFFSLEFLDADLKAKNKDICSYHTWPTEGPMICQRCAHNPAYDIASKEDFEIDE